MNAIETNDNKTTIRIDFAPMVDLGFLLITFFIFTTKMQESKAFKLNMPDDTIKVDDPPQSPESATITLMMKENGIVDYYEGREDKPMLKGTVGLYSKPSVRDQLMDKRKRIVQQLGNDSNYTVIIQPSVTTSYKEIVDVLDEMQITAIKKYVLLEDKVANK